MKIFHSLLTIFILFVIIIAQPLKIDSVYVDSIWNSDSTWNSLGTWHSRISRDCILRFKTAGQGTAESIVKVSFDSGHTWDIKPQLFSIVDTSLFIPFTLGGWKKYHIRLLTGDSDGVVFRVVCRQTVPSISGSPGNYLINGSVDSLCKIPLHVEEVFHDWEGQSKINKFYWNFLGDVSIDDSSVIPDMIWIVKIPDYTKVIDSMYRTVKVFGKDANGIVSPTEALSITFHPSKSDIDTGNITVGSFDCPDVGTAMDLDKGLVYFTIQAIQTGSGADIVGSYFSSKKSYMIFNPVYARDSTNVYGYGLWKDPPLTLIKIINFNFDFEKIVLKSQLEYIYTSSTSNAVMSTSAKLADKFVIKTDQNKYALIQLVGFDKSDHGIAEYKYRK